MSPNPLLPGRPARRFIAAAGLALCGVFVRLAAADDPKAGTPTSNPPSSYTDRGSTTSTYTSFPTFQGSYHFGTRFPDGRFGGVSHYSVTTRYRSISFPPTPPALGEPIPANTTRGSLARFAPPAVLANYVYEPFYAPLSPLLFSEDLDRRRREKLDGYRAARTAALDALRAKLASLQTTEGEARAAALAAFAAEQAPALAELEATAEALRDNFVNGGFFQTGSDWNWSRQWRLGDDTRWESTTDEIKVMIGAAFFQDGLSPAQRRLLRELAMELSDSLQVLGSDISLDTSGPFFYFTPEMARIRLPVNMPAGLAAQVASYQQQKLALKTELREVLYKQDRTLFDFRRREALKALAEQQAPRFAALEQLAEEIRVGLAPLPNPASPPALPLPRELATRITTYLAQKSEWQRTMLARIETLRAEFPEDRVEYVRQGAGLAIQVVGHRKSSADVRARREAAQTALASFNAAQNERYLALARDKETIRLDVIKAVTNATGAAANRSIDQLIRQFNYAFGQQERWERYHDYELAVLQPGLSAAQRRLLFAAAVEKLDLPLNNSF